VRTNSTPKGIRYHQHCQRRSDPKQPPPAKLIPSRHHRCCRRSLTVPRAAVGTCSLEFASVNREKFKATNILFVAQSGREGRVSMSRRKTQTAQKEGRGATTRAVSGNTIECVTSTTPPQRGATTTEIVPSCSYQGKRDRAIRLRLTVPMLEIHYEKIFAQSKPLGGTKFDKPH